MFGSNASSAGNNSDHHSGTPPNWKFQDRARVAVRDQVSALFNGSTASALADIRCSYGAHMEHDDAQQFGRKSI